VKLPRDISGQQLAKQLAELGYKISRQNGEHHITIPRNDPLKIGTFSAILNDIANHFAMSREELAAKLFLTQR
jgi:predicted RNA binding protein YcfA (HicA-like mRNA interferase family)